MSNKIPIKAIILVGVMILFLLVSNIFFIYKYYKQQSEEIIQEKIIFNNDKEYEEEKKYYTEINYKKFNNLLKKEKPSTIAIIDNSSKTYNRFLSLINKIAYYKKTSIYVLEISKLNKNNEISFYETDERLKTLESDYLITIGNNRIISVTEFNTEELTTIIDNIK